MTNNLVPKLIISGDQIKARVAEIAAEIRRDFEGEDELIIVCVLRGAVVFFCDLVKELSDITARLDFITLSSYENAMITGGCVTLVQDLRERVEGKSVLVVEDIVDSGRTLQYIRGFFDAKRVKKLSIASLLDKPMRRQVDANADYVAFTLERDAFVVGYGLDCGQLYRNLNGIYEMTGD